MAQQFRAGGRSNRSGRSQADHDVFEGLPVRQWHHSETIVGLPPPAEVAQGGDNAWPELPMPRDSSQLAPWTQQLLREARRPRLAKRPQEPTEDDKQEEEEEGEAVQTGWQSKKWSQVPSQLEKPEREFLAKRRKGLPSLHTQIALQAANAAASSAPTRKTKVMKSDADGNTTVYEVLVAEGQTIEGEVTEDAIMADAAPVQAAPGTVIEGVGIANAEGVIVATDLLQQQQPMRRKPIPPRRIRKGGPGRGKKKVMFNPNDGHNAAASSTPGGISVATPSTLNANADDSAMDIDSNPKPDANDEGDDEDGEDGEEGDEDDDREDDDRGEDHEDGELSEGEEPHAEEDELASKPETMESTRTEPQAEEQLPPKSKDATAPLAEELQNTTPPVMEEIAAPVVEETEHTTLVPIATEISENFVEQAETQEPAIAIEEPAIAIEEPAIAIEEPGFATEEPSIAINEATEPPIVSITEEVVVPELPQQNEPEREPSEKDMIMEDAPNQETEES
ncbi:hypothetical protein AUEXF2481DRAFT_38281 [Aureobasidium subglaciale EXF-2481]|uniref:Apopolysialoglycoprotein n=1 Tax=Aureobasidium subglaciale (strain EXF-2481) TaxID=1043005 RepID=A0A074YRY5_AURSE|nr:uncharacterized protein AUEXF2481DRAFT_38281 [Aureobasidium subglaciale EXF-2481]KAI5209355.1 hypothetical protein E4T38_02385 [Aureobasidium subglaciale]KAI5228083.1 hypothetical protein E4T40_02164 [Aureobasidium subglaciale]KAI5231346.1 hypothetical protein E4T41_02384 [Aureobasidium subglaciale]KAI5265420.1 hypothetical protein E4T46_02162 [Aureobasidium subglaciale]KEQ96872.1 hypothetical protein AUEXF2481DRAFT_38281 [Aureobasidium subglaciale EXF-2481]